MKVNTSRLKDEYANREYKAASSPKEVLLLLLKIAAFIAGGIIAVIIAFYLLFLWCMAGTTYKHFGKSRTREMEREYGISVDDNVKLLLYEADIGFDNDKVLDLETSDYEKFIKENINFDIEDIEYSEEHIRFHYKLDSDSVFSNIGVGINTKPKENGKYQVTLWTPYKEY
ncbi:MAG: hypothetical protein WBK46_01385 [Ruminococcus flavefaciens]